MGTLAVRTAGRGADSASRVSITSYIVRKHAAAAGLDGIHAHSLRHSAASNALAGGMDLVAVRDLLGHSSIGTTSKYLHATSSAVANVSAGLGYRSGLLDICHHGEHRISTCTR